MSSPDSSLRHENSWANAPQGASSQEALDRLARVAARTLGAATVVVSVSGEGGDRVRSAVGLAEPYLSRRWLPRGHSLARPVAQRGEALLVSDVRTDPLTGESPLFAELGIAACAGAPLRTDDGTVFGCLEIWATEPRAWTADTLAVLDDLAAIASAELLPLATQADQALAHGAELFDQLFAGAPEAAVLLDRRDRVVRANAQFLRVFGYPEEEVLWQPINGLIVPEDQVEEARGMSQRVCAGERLEAAMVRRAKNGAAVHVSMLASPLWVGEEQVGIFVVYRDITEQQLARAALRQSEERFRSLIEHSSDVVAILSAGGTLEYVTPSVERVLGYAAGELTGTSTFALIHPDDAPEVIARFTRGAQDAFCEGDLELRARHRDGSWRVLAAHATNLLDDPAVRGVVVNSRDVTEERIAEEGRRRLNTFLEATPDFVATFDPRGRALSINTAFRRAAGLAESDGLASVTISDLFPPAVTERLLHEGIPTAIRDGLWSGETMLETAGGEQIPISQLILAHRSASGEVEFLSTLGRDITDRKQAETSLRESEAHFRSLIENAQDIITILDADGAIRYESPSIERVLGYRPDELVGVNAFELLHPDDVPAMQEEFEAVVRTPGAIRRVEFRIRHKDGRWRVLEATAQHALDQPVVHGVVVNSRDITERQEAEAALRESEEQLRQSQKMEAVGRLAGGVAHDFNNLLTAIKGFTELLLLDIDPRDPRRSFVTEIQSAANRAAGLTRQLLAFSRKQVLQPRVLDLNGAVTDLDKMLRRLIGEDVELRTELAADLGRVRADPGQIEQVIMNLVVNARDAMLKGGEVVITTSNATLGEEHRQRYAYVLPGRYARLTVSDTGTGMDEETLSRIFEPFFTTKEQGKGTGLGLSTVYGIVKQSGGYVWAHSQPGQGATFEIYLPQVPEQVERRPERTATGPVQGSETVLLVEDEQAVRVLMRRVLDRNGYRVLEAASGPDALELLEEHRGSIDLLLTDVVMPGFSGRELADRLVPRFPQMKVLYMSGYTDEAIVHHGVLDEGVAFLEKPFTPDILLRKLRTVLGASDAARA